MTGVTNEVSSISYQYDANGNMTQRIENGVTWTQTYNAENRLASLNNGTTTWLFSYDGNGNRVSHLVTDGVTATNTYYFMGGGYEVTSDGVNTTVRKYYAIAGQTYGLNDNGVMKYFFTDHLGSIVAVTDASGTLLEESRYLPFGQVRSDVGNITQTDKTYTSQKDLANTGLMDYNARMYSPELGRFIQADTIVPSVGNSQAWNIYAYVLNNPIRANDPSGHIACWDENRNDEYCKGLQPTAKGLKKKRPYFLQESIPFSEYSNNVVRFTSYSFMIGFGPLHYYGSLDVLYKLDMSKVAFFYSHNIPRAATESSNPIYGYLFNQGPMKDTLKPPYDLAYKDQIMTILPNFALGVEKGLLTGEAIKNGNLRGYEGPSTHQGGSIQAFGFDLFQGNNKQSGALEHDKLRGLGFSLSLSPLPADIHQNVTNSEIIGQFEGRIITTLAYLVFQ